MATSINGHVPGPGEFRPSPVKQSTTPASAPSALAGISGISGDLGATIFGQDFAKASGLLSSGESTTLNLTAQQRYEMKQIGAAALTGGPSAELQSRWSSFVSEVATTGGGGDVNALVQEVLRESYMQTTEDLRFYAEKVQFFNDLKKSIRAELTRARAELSKHAGAADTAALEPPYTGQDFTLQYSGSGVAAGEVSGEDISTKGKLDTYIKSMEDKLNSVGDDAQLANVDLQNVLQKQQQTLQMMSNISKMLHDTAMAVIRKIGG